MAIDPEVAVVGAAASSPGSSGLENSHSIALSGFPSYLSAHLFQELLEAVITHALS